jgi:pilus assembly protein CpaF
VTIRKFTLRPYGPDDLVRMGSLSDPMMEFLAASVRGKANIIVSGGTGTGKTTLLGVLSSFIPSGERLITIEDAAELRLPQPHVVSLEARPPNVEGAGEVTVRALVRNALRMRPDRIIVGEVRGGEALDMLQAMNTGHEGSMSTAHANSPRDTLSRLETMALMSDVELPVSHVREQVAGALDLIVHLNRMPDGRRGVSRISAVEGLHGSTVRIDDVFVWHRRPTPGFVPTGTMPSLLALLEERDERIDPRVFTPPSGARTGALIDHLPDEAASPHRPAREAVRGTHAAVRSRANRRWPGLLRRLGTIVE